jgi:hypothetical protein
MEANAAEARPGVSWEGLADMLEATVKKGFDTNCYRLKN